MKDTLKEIVCEALQEDECVGHCNYLHCYKVNTVVDNLIKHNVILAPCAIGDTVYYIAGIHGRAVKPASVEEIYYNGCDFSLRLVSENNTHFDMHFDIPADKVYATEEDCLKHIKGGNQ